MSTALTTASITQRIEGYQARIAPVCWAAVALVLGEGPSGPEVLMIRRVTRNGDRWSGDMALPGGKQEANDVSVEATAARETLEETAVAVGPLIGRLDDIEGRPTSNQIATVVFTVDGRPEAIPEPGEAAEAVWLPLAALVDPGSRTWHRYGGVVPFRSITVGNYMIWGLTHRILTHFFSVTGLD